MFRSYSWLCTQQSLLAGLRGYIWCWWLDIDLLLAFCTISPVLHFLSFFWGEGGGKCTGSAQKLLLSCSGDHICCGGIESRLFTCKVNTITAVLLLRLLFTLHFYIIFKTMFKIYFLLICMTASYIVNLYNKHWQFYLSNP